MEKEIIEKWENGKNNLRNYLENNLTEITSNSYNQLVKTLISQCLNYNSEFETFSEDFTCIDHGCYQGTQIFILHIATYQPDVDDYYYFANYYGSCSACDTLQGILIHTDWETGLPSKDQVDQLMALCLHMIQKMKRMC